MMINMIDCSVSSFRRHTQLQLTNLLMQLKVCVFLEVEVELMLSYNYKSSQYKEKRKLRDANRFPLTYAQDQEQVKAKLC